MNLTIYALSFLTISQLLLTGLYNLVFSRDRAIRFLMSLLCLCLIAAVISMAAPFTTGTSFEYLLNRFTLATPAVLWLTARHFFDDSRRIPVWMWVILLSYQIARAISPFLFPEQSEAFGLVAQLSYPIMLGLIVHVIVIALRGRSVDLVEPRRQLRVPVSVGLSVILAIILVLALIVSLLPSEQSAVYWELSVLASLTMLFLFVLSVNLATWSIFDQLMAALDESSSPQSSMPDESSALETAGPDADKTHECTSPRVLNRITALMNEEMLYRRSDLTIGELASRVFVGEHRLRKFINKEMGYRNFNQFLNQYRVRDAQKLLLTAPQTPISTIAMDVGYASLSSFNKAFKEITGVTPSNFRNNEGRIGTERPENPEIQSGGTST